jgi:hypothetical protein
MVDSTWAALNTQNTDLIRKTLAGGAAFIAPMSATAITNLTGTSAVGTIQALPAGYLSIGLMSEDGASFPREIETSEVNSWGVKEPTRSDTTKDQSGCKIIAQETKMTTLAAYLGTDLLTSLVADATTGEVKIDKPQAPALTYYRLLVIGRDSTAEGDVYLGRFFPRAQITERDELVMGSGDDPVQYGLTFKAFYDSTLATSERYFWAGAGWKARKAAMGF